MTRPTPPPQSRGAGLIVESPLVPGSPAVMWGNVLSPFGSCSRYGGCPDIEEVAADVHDRTTTRKPDNRPSITELLGKLEGVSPRQKSPTQYTDINDILTHLKNRSWKATDPAEKAKLQAMLNEFIDLSQTHLNNNPSPRTLGSFKEKFEAYNEVGKMIGNIDKLGIQGQDLSYSRLNTHSGAFAENTLQAGLQYRDALLLQLKTRPAGSNFEKDVEDFRKLTDRLGELAPQRKQEFEAYRDQALQALQPAGLKPPGM